MIKDKRLPFIFTHPAEALTTLIPNCASLFRSEALDSSGLQLAWALGSGAEQHTHILC